MGLGLRVEERRKRRERKAWKEEGREDGYVAFFG